jgi:diacylglycerol O-acyltransferase
MTLAFRRYAELHHTNLSGRQLRVVVPVNLRGEGEVSDLGNRITFLPVNVPLDVKDPHKLLTTVSARMAFLRSVGVAEFVGLAGSLISKIPLPVQALLAPVASQLPLSVCNTICTNVPGPQFPLYLMGHKMLRWYPYVPIGGEMGINTAILSYDGMVYFGYSGDVHAAPDLQRLEKFTERSFADVLKAAGLRPTERKTVEAKLSDDGDRGMRQRSKTRNRKQVEEVSAARKATPQRKRPRARANESLAPVVETTSEQPVARSEDFAAISAGA